jgi:hypothetical protein
MKSMNKQLNMFMENQMAKDLLTVLIAVEFIVFAMMISTIF